MLAGARDRQPIAHFRRARVQAIGGDAAQSLRILVAQGLQHHAVKLLVDGEMAQAAGAQNAKARVAGICFHGLRDGAAKIVAARGARLVGRKISVDGDRHDGGDGLAHEALVHEAERVALAMIAAEAL